MNVKNTIACAGVGILAGLGTFYSAEKIMDSATSHLSANDPAVEQCVGALGQVASKSINGVALPPECDKFTTDLNYDESTGLIYPPPPADIENVIIKGEEQARDATIEFTADFFAMLIGACAAVGMFIKYEKQEDRKILVDGATNFLREYNNGNYIQSQFIESDLGPVEPDWLDEDGGEEYGWS